jgi:hypothetical protein
LGAEAGHHFIDHGGNHPLRCLLVFRFFEPVQELVEGETRRQDAQQDSSDHFANLRLHLSCGLPREESRQSVEATKQVGIKLVDVLEVLILQEDNWKAQPAYEGPSRLRQREDLMGIYMSAPAELFILVRLEQHGITTLLQRPSRAIQVLVLILQFAAELGNRAQMGSDELFLGAGALLGLLQRLLQGGHDIFLVQFEHVDVLIL